MSEKAKYLRSATAQVQLKEASLAKVRAFVLTRRTIGVEEKARLEILKSDIKAIWSCLGQLADARINEWNEVRERIDQRLDALQIPAAQDWNPDGQADGPGSISD